MVRSTSLIIGVISFLSVLLPSLASASSWKVQDFDTASGNGSLYQRVISGQEDHQLRVYASIIDPKTGAVQSFDQASLDAQTLAVKVRYVSSYECAEHIDLTKCLAAKQ